MHITLNDTAHETSATTVGALLAEILGEVPAAGTAVALDGEVVPRSSWQNVRLHEGVRVDVLTAVQGG